MTILALEFSSEHRSVALARAGHVLASAVETGGVRMTNAFGLIGKVLSEANVSRSEVEVIAVGLGPGSYTGVRAAIAVAQGWQLALGVKLLGISSVEALAARAQSGKIFGRVNVVVDAQRGEFYLSTWDISANERAEVTALKIVSAAEVAEPARKGTAYVGPSAATPLYPDAASLALLATGEANFVSGDRLEPIYLRETTFVKTAVARFV